MARTTKKAFSEMSAAHSAAMARHSTLRRLPAANRHQRRPTAATSASETAARLAVVKAAAPSPAQAQPRASAHTATPPAHSQGFCPSRHRCSSAKAASTSTKKLNKKAFR